MKWMISLFVLLLTLGFLGGCVPDGKKQAAGRPNKSEMDDTEKKLSSNLLALVNDKFLPANTTKETYLQQQQELGSVLEATANGTSALCAYVYVQLAKDASVDAVTPYLFELRNKDENNGLLAAYVDIGRLKELAARQEVQSIRTVVAPVSQ